MNRRAFLATTAAAAAAATMKAASAASVTPFGQTGATTLQTPLPLGPLPGSRYPDPHLEAVKPQLAFQPTSFPAFARTMSVERVASGLLPAEGPVDLSAGRYVVVSYIPNNRTTRLSA